MFLTDLADVLRAAGLSVTEVDGWRTRGYDGDGDGDPGDDLRSVECIAIHHTATPWSRAGDYPTLSTVRDGRSDVAGPLAQLGLGRSGEWYVIAAGRANHTGATHQAWQHNAYALGIEGEASGVGDPRDWPPAQMASYARGVAALAAHYGVPVDRVLGHKEIAAPTGRKTDPSFDMAAFRAAVRNPTNLEDTLSAKAEDSIAAVETAIGGTITDDGKPITPREALARVLRTNRQLVTKVERLEGDEQERAVAQKRRDDASAAREKLLLSTVETLAQNVGVDPDLIVQRLDAALENLTITLTT